MLGTASILKNKISALILLAILFVRCQISHGQNLTANDGFEGSPSQGTPPSGWHNCNDGSSTGDTQPGYFHNHLAASEGSTYTSVVTRAVSTPGTVETIWSELETPFEKNRCYFLDIDVALSDQFYANFNFDDYYFFNPCVLQIFGFNGDCASPENKELLWQSGIIDNSSWKSFNISFIPSNDYSNISIRPFFSDPDVFTNSALLIDNLKLKSSDAGFIHRDGIFFLPSSASGIKWYFNTGLVEGEDSLQMPYLGSGIYTAEFYDSGLGCIVSSTEYLLIDNDWIKFYPNPTAGDFIYSSYSIAGGFSTVYLYDAAGRIVMVKSVALIKGKNEIAMDLKGFAAGTYHIKVIRPNRADTRARLVLLK